MKLVITHHRPLRKALLTIAGVLGLLLAFALAFDYGHWRMIAGAMVASGDQRELLDEVMELRRTNDQLHYDLTRARRAEEVGRAAREEARERMVELEGEISALNREVQFFRDVVGNAKVGAGPRVGGIHVRPLDGAGRFEYALVMTHIEKDDRLAEGHLKLRVAGDIGGKQRSLSFAEIVESGPSSLDFKFKHFHLIEGTLKIPPEFVPRRIEVAVLGRSATRDARAETFDWASALN